LLDQAVAFGGKRVEADQLMILLCAVPHELLRGVLEAVLARDAAGALKALAAVQDHGCDVRQFCGELMEHVRNLLVAKIVPDAGAARGESRARSAQTRSAGRTTVQGERARSRLGATRRTTAADPRGDAVTTGAAGVGESGLGSGGRTDSCRAAQRWRVPRRVGTGGCGGRSGDGRLSRGGRDRPEDDAAGKLPAGGRGGVLGAGWAASARARRVTGGRNGRADGRAASTGARSD